MSAAHFLSQAGIQRPAAGSRAVFQVGWFKTKRDWPASDAADSHRQSILNGRPHSLPRIQAISPGNAPPETGWEGTFLCPLRLPAQNTITGQPCEIHAGTATVITAWTKTGWAQSDRSVPQDGRKHLARCCSAAAQAPSCFPRISARNRNSRNRCFSQPKPEHWKDNTASTGISDEQNSREIRCAVNDAGGFPERSTQPMVGSRVCGRCAGTVSHGRRFRFPLNQ